MKFIATFALLVASVATPQLAAAVIVPVQEDIMASSFFQGTNTIRGYAGDNRPVFRVSTNDPFGTVGAETIYLTFDPAQFSGLTGPVNATLTLQSTDGGFGANAGSGNPFTVSAHAVASNPLTTIIDDTNPGGTKSWIDFYNNDILPADSAALTAVDSFGPVTFDVSAVVNDWLSGANSVFALALTGKNDVSGNEFLHGFLNNTEAAGSTFLTVAAVPEPSSVALSLAATAMALVVRKRKS
jgi:hypothetical protein